MGSIAPGGATSSVWNNANPTTLTYLPGVNSTGATTTSPCQFSVSRSYYRQHVNTDGTLHRQFVLTVTNVGTIACTATTLLAAIT